MLKTRGSLTFLQAPGDKHTKTLHFLKDHGHSLCDAFFMFLYFCKFLLCFRTSWASYYQNRNLRAYSAYPLLLYPTHYVGDEGWFSDTGN